MNKIFLFCLYRELIWYFCIFTHSLGLARTGGGSLPAEARRTSSSESLEEPYSSSSGSLKCTRRPTLEPERGSLWFVMVPVFRQEFGGGSGRDTTVLLWFWFFEVFLTSRVSEGLDPPCSEEVSAAGKELPGFG